MNICERCGWPCGKQRIDQGGCQSCWGTKPYDLVYPEIMKYPIARAGDIWWEDGELRVMIGGVWKTVELE